MPMRDFKCKKCNRLQERVYGVRDGKISVPLCDKDVVVAAFSDRCLGELEMMPLSAGHVRGKTAIFPFTTTHMTGDGKPVVVNDLGHLRRLERKHGVNVSGFSQDPGNPDSPRDLPVNRPGGREYEPRDTRIFR